MDAAAVAAARGLATNTLRPRHVVTVAIAFGGAQALMPLAGALLGELLGDTFEAWSRIIAAGLLFVVGGKMAWEARGGDEDDDDVDAGADDAALYGSRVILGLAIATSIDAFGAGVSLSMLGAPLVSSVIIIGVTTAILSAAGLLLGRRAGAMLGRRLDVVGAVVLIGLGVKILAEGLLSTSS